MIVGFDIAATSLRFGKRFIHNAHDMPESKKIEAIHTDFPPNQHTVPEVFIIESLDAKDEKAKRYEGRLLSEMLILAGKSPKYYYFQSKSELPHLIALFRLSQYRYLHFSAHANNDTIGTTNDSMTYDEFADFFKSSLRLRRLFMSACEVGNEDFVKAVSSKNKGMHSIVAPKDTIRFDHAAAIWSAFYVSMFTENQNAMKSREIAKRIDALNALFPVDFYQAFYNSKQDIWEFKD
ncbi:MAG: hypothetical protein JST12_05630 [Armatimonadetes bacterium]|nr:hypothetical protein [Armatimonadota bacterium]